MDIEQVKELQRKISKAKEQKARAEGAIENITGSWKKNYGFSTVEEAEEHIKELEEKQNALDQRQQKLVNDLDALVDWDEL